MRCDVPCRRDPGGHMHLAQAKTSFRVATRPKREGTLSCSIHALNLFYFSPNKCTQTRCECKLALRDVGWRVLAAVHKLMKSAVATYGGGVALMRCMHAGVSVAAGGCGDGQCGAGLHAPH